MSAAGTILALALVASTGGEHGGGEHEFHLFEYISTVTNFVVMFGFLAYVVKKPLATHLVTRRDGMAVALREAKEKQALAEQRIAEYKHRLDHLEEEVERIVKSYEREAEADRQQLAQETDRAIERISREAEFTIHQEVRKAEKAIRAAAARVTLEAAEDLVKQKITEADQRRLADNYIAGLEASAGRA